MKTIDNFFFKDKIALIRVDFNVPLDEHLKITDDTRIRAAKPTIQKIIKDGGAVILMSHLGRPKGIEQKYSLKNIVPKVSEVLGIDVKFSSTCVGKEAEDLAKSLKPKEVLLLENLRYFDEETKGGEEFAKKLAKLGDIYVNDAFGTAHRAHASTTVIAKFFPNHKCFGYLLAKEIESINKVLADGEKPITAILGGSKVSSKITIIENILDAVDNLIIGGGMAFTFVKALGGKIGNSICEDDKQQMALDILEKAKLKNVKICLPTDVIIADDFSNNANTKISDIKDIPNNWQGLDAGPNSLDYFKEVLLKSKTILWNGPVGVFEMSKFANGTIKVGEYVAEATKKGAFSLVGGGDSIAAVRKFNLVDKVSYVSTGGGAMLESLEGKSLPGIDIILN